MELTVFDERIYELINPASPLIKLADGFRFTEGAVYADGACWFTDFYLDRIYKYENGEVILITDESNRTIGMTRLRDGRIIGCASNLHAIIDIADGIIVDSYKGVRLNGTNDVIEDSRGRIYFSDPLVRPIEGEQIGHSCVFIYDGKKLVTLDETLPWPNGLALSPDEKTLYIVDSKNIALYSLDMESHELNLFIQLDRNMGGGLPDGMRVDSRGNIYLAGPGGISLISPEGVLLGLIKMPEVAANLCFDETGLFITASTSIYHVDLK